MPIIKINEISMYYEIHGTGAPLVLIAGYTGDYTFWKFIVPNLAKHHQVIIFDNRGIGQTQDKGGFFTLEAMAEDVLSLMKALNLEQPAIAGHSMGGIIAQIIAKKHPKQISRLVVLNSAQALNIRTYKTLESLLNLRKDNVSFDGLIDTALPWFFANDYLANPENIIAFKKDLINNPFPQSVEDQERQFRALQAYQPSQWSQKINLPSLILGSEHDIITLPEESELLAESIPNSQFVLVEGAHSSPVEQPELVYDLILKFLKAS